MMIRRIFYFAIFLTSIKCVAQSDTISDYAQKVISIVKDVEKKNKLVGQLDPKATPFLPIGLQKTIGSTKYTIAIDSGTFKPNGAFFSAYMAIDFPGTTQTLAFAAKGLTFNPKGVGTGAMTRLMLVSRDTIDISSNIKLVLTGDGGNYVDWDCNGFKTISLKGLFVFKSNLILPDSAITSERTVTATFQLITNDIHNVVADLSMTPFCIKGLNDFSFKVTDAVVDMSELANSPGMVFPSGYSNASGVLWTGFYLRQLTVGLPKELSKSGNRIVISATNFLIDKTGVSGNIGVSNLFSLSEGSMSNWPFSVDQLSVNFLSNQVNGGSIAGEIQLPISDGGSLGYTASIFQNHKTNETDYSFLIQPKTGMSFSAFSATLDLKNTCSFSITKTNGRLIPVAILNGDITVTANSIKSPPLTFEHLTITTEAPYVTSGVFGLTGVFSASVDGFFGSIDSIRVILDSKHPELDVVATIGFMSEPDEGFSATAGVGIIAKIVEAPVKSSSSETTTTKTVWKFDRVAVREIGLDVETEPFSLIGGIAYKENDPIYGTGVFGSISFTLHSDPTEFAFAVNAGFGRKDELHYWYVEGMLEMTIPLPPYANIKRLMGGMYYHMRPKGTASFASLAQNLNPNNKSKVIINYLPDATAGYGFKAGVTLAYIQSESTLNGDIMITVNLNSSGGLSSLALDGVVACMVTIDERQKLKPEEEKLYGEMHMLFDNTNSTFHAVMGIWVNIPGLKGSGQTELHFSPTDWHVCIGKPKSPVSVTLLETLTVSSYFMVGEHLDPMPDPDALVMSIVNSNGIGKSRNLTSLQSGKGFATGLKIFMGGNGNFGYESASIYYSYSAVAGFDVMIADYGSNAKCSSTGQKLGANGWYCQGQLYFGLQAKFGAHIDVWCLPTFDGEILSLSAAALLQAQVPNPSHMSGTVAANLKVLSVYSWSYSMDFDWGTSCGSIIN